MVYISGMYIIVKLVLNPINQWEEYYYDSMNDAYRTLYIRMNTIFIVRLVPKEFHDLLFVRSNY